MNAEVDIREVLPLVRVPSLVLHRSGDRCLVVDEGRYLASRIPGARFIELPGNDHLPFVGDQDAIVSAVLAQAGIAASAGLHTGECAQRNGGVEGMAVSVARAIAERAAPGELLISRTVKNLVAGAAFSFTERGRHVMPEDAGEWRLYAVQSFVGV